MNAVTEALKDQLIKVAVNQAMSALVAKAAFFGFGPVKWLTTILLTKFLAFMIDKTVIGANVLIIKADVSLDVDRMEKAIKKATEAKPDATKEELDAIDKELKEAASNLIPIVGRSRL